MCPQPHGLVLQITSHHSLNQQVVQTIQIGRLQILVSRLTTLENKLAMEDVMHHTN